MRVILATDESAVPEAMAALDAGELVLLPGDLRYFVAADALDDDACERIFAATQRGADRTLTVILSGYADLHHVGYGGASVREVADARWPGPNVLSVRPRPWVPDAVTAGYDTLRVYAPAQPFTNALARQFGPIAVASARIQGQPNSLDAKTAADRLGPSVALAVDGGALPGGEEGYFLTEG